MAKRDLKKELVPLFLVTVRKYDFNVYEKRVLYCVLEVVEADIEGRAQGEGVSFDETMTKNKAVIMPLSNFIKEGGRDEERLKIIDAFERLRSISMKIDNDKLWAYYHMVETPIRFTENKVHFQISKYMYRDLASLFKKYGFHELQMMLDFRI